MFRPSPNFLPLMVTCFSAVGVYYLLSRHLRLSDTVSMGAGIFTSFILSLLFARWRGRKGSK